ncbi:MAG TPA: pentapeptide repeat-containing protein [Patescibacteria group bacterium]|nr:pentapeptide repeat-containing protein [Patescibacteria group bacterium]
MEEKELKIKLELHLKWLKGEGGGERADLSSADLRSADLSYANLSYANLNSADLSSADLSYANLRSADLRSADLSSADLSYANLPSPTMLLLAVWYSVSAQLTLDLMRYDASNHPDPSKFDDWAKGGACPYSDIRWQRCANFEEDRKLWKPGKTTKSALELVLLLFKEKEIKR